MSRARERRTSPPVASAAQRRGGMRLLSQNAQQRAVEELNVPGCLLGRFGKSFHEHGGPQLAGYSLIPSAVSPFDRGCPRSPTPLGDPHLDRARQARRNSDPGR